MTPSSTPSLLVLFMHSIAQNYGFPLMQTILRVCIFHSQCYTLGLPCGVVDISGATQSGQSRELLKYTSIHLKCLSPGPRHLSLTPTKRTYNSTITIFMPFHKHRITVQQRHIVSSANSSTISCENNRHNHIRSTLSPPSIWFYLYYY